MTRIQAPRGAPDVLPPASELLSEVEGVARTLFDRYGYRRIETPMFEHTDVFVRAAGEGSDVVIKKQMYTFEDASGRSLTLRPEGTAPVVRAFVEHRMDGTMPLPVRLYYLGPMFRYERPQKGRTRQFEQIGIEAIGSGSPLVDAETIVLGAEFFAGIGLDVDLILNSMGCRADQDRYRDVVRQVLEPKIDELCDDCEKRLRTNPLRVFDCKVPSCEKVIASVPPITEWLCDDCALHHRRVQEVLEVTGVAWRDAADLVRGFDYYTRTVFEFDLASLGARSAVCGGGRYDGLVRDMGGPELPGVGFAIGVEPTMVALAALREPQAWKPDVYVAILSEEIAAVGMALARDLRAAGCRVTSADDPSRSLKSQLREADRLGAAHAVILGPQEVERRVAAVRDLRDRTQEEIALDELVTKLC